MGHNASQSRKRANALAAYLGDVTRWRVIATCDPCGRRVELGADVLAERHGARTTVGSVVHRLRCATCRAHPSGVWVGDRQHIVAVCGPLSMA